MLEVIGFALAVMIGISLGLIGGGGSILTVPILAYLLAVPPVMATAYSLFIVGASSLFGGFRYARQGLVDFQTAILFGLPSIAAVFLTRKFLVPAIPYHILNIGNIIIDKDMLLMLLFAALMVVASYSMIRKKTPAKSATAKPKTKLTPPVIAIVLLEGAVVGTLTGLVGAGGGFLIIPALVVVAGLQMKMAVGTSLIIIAVKSLIGFLGDVSNYTIDWVFLLSFTGLAVLGIFLGSLLSTKINGAKLKTGFGWFVLFMGVFVLLKELL